MQTVLDAPLIGQVLIHTNAECAYDIITYLKVISQENLSNSGDSAKVSKRNRE